MRDKLQKLLFQLSLLPRALKLVWQPVPVLTLIWTVLLIVQGVIPGVTVYLTGTLVDSLVKAIAIGESSESIRIILRPAILMGAVMALSMISNECIGWINTAQSEFIRDYIKALVHQKASEIDLAFYESPEYYNRLDQVQSNAIDHPLELMQSLGQLIQNTITAISIIIVLLPYGIWLPFILVISTTPALFVVLHFNRKYHTWWDRSTIKRRWAGYYNSMLTSEFAAAELRLFDLSDTFQTAYQKIRKILRTQLLKILRDQALVRLAAKTITVAIGSLALFWMLWQAIIGVLTLGNLALFYQAFNRGQGLMRSFLGSIGQIYHNSLYLENLFDFFDFKPSIIDPQNFSSLPKLIAKGITFKNVSFRYPGSKTYVLKDFNLTIYAGQITAIVGDNGAGKSTLLNLICRFYDPESGTIEIDGIDIRNFRLRELWDNITVMFQFPMQYQATVTDNIAFGNIIFRKNSNLELKNSAVKEASLSAGAHDFVVNLPQSYDTLLSKSLAEGVELSGGEWQKIALARAFLRKSSLIILDEPTSAMDPWAEAQWLDRFDTMFRDRTAIIITHRFTAAMRADCIYLIKNGRVVEAGNHNELIRKEGLYAQAWIEQTQTKRKSASLKEKN